MEDDTTCQARPTWNLFRIDGFVILSLAFLVVGCGAPITSAPPSPSVAAVATAVPTPSPTLQRRPTPVPIDLDTCEIVIRTADHLEDVLLTLAEVLDDPDEVARLVNETADLADQQRDFLETQDSTNPTLIGWVGILAEIDESVVPHLTGDNTPFIEAIGRGALYADNLKAACS